MLPLRDYFSQLSTPEPKLLVTEEVSLGSARGRILELCLKLAGTIALSYITWRLIRQLDPTYQEKEKAKQLVAEMRKRLNLDPKVQMDDNEMIICTMVVVPSESDHWSRIGGCRSILAELECRVLTPLRLISGKFLPNSSLFTPPKGVLLHGPPGCGKTLIAKAIAQASGAKFILFDPAVLANKWFGESQKLVRALFTLAKKIQPCIIFIDEIDAFLRQRSINDQEVYSQMKTQFMCLWDGFSTSNDNVIVLGATNRPRDVDPAILRRLPLRFEVPLPSETEREQILRVILAQESVAPSVNYAKLARQMRGMSGSDIKEVCRSAALTSLNRAMAEMMPEHENNHQIRQQQRSTEPSSNLSCLEINETDLAVSIQQFSASMGLIAMSASTSQMPLD